MNRTHTNGQLRIEDVKKVVTLTGWVAKRRNFGALVFIDLRDREGITQLVFDEQISKEITDVRNEYVLEVSGEVVERKDKNPKMATGDIEIKVQSVTVLNTAKTTPIIIADETDALEDTRLKYRYLDLRRKVLQDNLRLRHEVTMIVRNFMSNQGFLEIETPILCKSTPEGARDYLVPSRISHGSFYALPQSPQLYKQLLMVGGLEKYFQIARCFRDEDLRADRQPEFTQIDIEMSFADEEDIFAIIEQMMQEIFQKIKGITLSSFTRMKYVDCMNKYGSDKPDTRFDLFLNDVTSVFTNTEFVVFKNILENGGIINALVVDGSDSFSRKTIDAYQEHVRKYGAKALSFLKYNGGELSGSIAKTLSENEKESLISNLQLQDNQIVFFIADKKKVVQQALGALRAKLGKDLSLVDESAYNFLWVTNYPMFEYVEEEDRYVACHHPFTSVNDEDIDKLLTDKENCYSRAYDLVLNGSELLSGSIRIHDQELQEKVFEAIGMSKEEANDKFGFFIEAFQYGTPPHCGVGIGLERIMMILTGTDNIRDVVAFPKTASASCLMSDAPNPVDESQLKELGLK